ncbi:trypsin-like peptidase domain-containing protein [Treponema sp.]|uniref:S1C family serine protease n=1 Tax=Treponema sp. TaxID=166 RepID=UPI0025CEFE43|nr:trypsin-like peptidase domain-containing protein [Treponema sp.]MCR5218130.1 trypsin-like peptidase domain-containing protein [Treponema sp.]
MKLYSGKQVLLTGLLCAAAGAGLVFYLFRQSAADDKNTGINAKAEDYLSSDAAFPITDAVSQFTSNDSSGYTKDELQNIQVYEKCNEAVVNITTQTMGYNWFYEPVITSSGSGSGSIIDVRGYVVTNYHVIKNASTITISLADGTSYDGRIIGQDKESDIAVLKFDPPENMELRTINFGENSGLKVGQKVIAIGNPFALERTMTTGIISGLGRPIQEDDVIIRNMIQTDAAINPGNSGGPLLDSSGNMIGINTMIYSSSGSSSGVGFAVPVSTAKRVVNDLIKYGKVNRGTIKVSLVQNTSRIASYSKSKISTGMIVSQVSKNSQAEKCGLKGGDQAIKYGNAFNYQTIYLGGDIITAINNITVSTLADYYSALEDKSPGDQVKVTVWRDGKYQVLDILLEE